jgi:general secretion pathway protein G
MQVTSRRHAFTTIELLTVVVVLAILVAVLIPNFTGAVGDAEHGVAMANLRSLRQQIALYKAQHNGKVPNASLAQLLIKTDVDGNPGADFGPYLAAVPTNPFTKSNKVTATADHPPSAASSASDRGWLYHEISGAIWLDEAGFLNK